ncbi:hypothetical protein V9T40_005786 [Parthenolecanium corni]|uniref:Serpin domain-containing protein n=1 Tax=Parthenolecanium corni TaxID=536013 RepID=A0AAN9TX83_9HEMI
MSSTYYVKVDEDGTDALLPEIENADSTENAFSLDPVRTVQFYVDHPFMFSLLKKDQLLAFGYTSAKIANAIANLGRKLMTSLEADMTPNENLLLSPANIFYAVALVHMAAGGNTLTEISTLMGIPPNQNYSKSDIHSTLSAFYKNIITDNEGPVILNIADALFLQNGFKIKEDYLTNAVKQYQAQIENVNFGAGKEAVDKINRWVSEKTKNRITKVAEDFRPDTLAVIMSTLYFNARWAHTFNKVKTQKEKFSTGENEVEVQMMSLIERLSYVNNAELLFESIDLPYAGFDYALNIILPYQNQTIKNLLPKLKDLSVNQIMEKKQYEGVEVKLPKIKFNMGKSLVKTFQQLGIADLFAGANLNDLTDGSVQISEIFHSAEIEIEEKGTVATGATWFQTATKVAEGISSLGRRLVTSLEKELSPHENLLLSPTNIFNAVALLHMGAGGNTLKELSTLMAIPPNKNYTKSEIHSTLSSFYKNITTDDKGPVILNIADALFLQNGFQVKKDFQDFAIKQYQAQIENVNFAVGNEGADKVNHWVSEKTRNRITKIVDTFPKDTQAVITTTLYFNAKWAYPFSEVETHKEKFSTGENEVDVQMMHLRERLPYVRNYYLDFESIDLPYDGSDYALNIILPYPNQTIKNLIPKLKDISVKQIMENYNYEGVDVKLPKTKFGVGKSLVKTFQQLGVHDLFTGANLNDLTDASVLVSEIFHKAEIEIQEKGTIATAATYLQIVPVSLPPPITDPILFHVNKPFIINIYDRKTSLNLFTGIVNNPVAT